MSPEVRPWGLGGTWEILQAPGWARLEILGVGGLERSLSKTPWVGEGILGVQ